jgi:hypothetical protein
MSDPKCRAKVPDRCWKHGNQQGIMANETIQRVITTPPKKYYISPEELLKAPLKQLNSTALALAIVEAVKKHPHIDGEKVNKAILLASHLHRNDTRANRGRYDKTPYIEHPLRNTLRALNYGSTSETVIIGSLLHDTVEDHPHEISTEFFGQTAATEEEARKNSYSFISKTYGDRTKDMVHGMSNPITSKYLPAHEKNKLYAEHVKEAIENPDVCIGKVCDFMDNAGGLHHNVAGMSAISIQKKTVKYLPVCDIIQKRLERDLVERKLDISEEGLKHMISQIVRTRKRLLILSVS